MLSKYKKDQIGNPLHLNGDGAESENFKAKNAVSDEVDDLEINNTPQLTTYHYNPEQFPYEMDGESLW